MGERTLRPTIMKIMIVKRMIVMTVMRMIMMVVVMVMVMVMMVSTIWLLQSWQGYSYCVNTQDGVSRPPGHSNPLHQIQHPQTQGL